MKSFMYKGIVISNDTCHIPHSRMIDMINDISKAITSEKGYNYIHDNQIEVIGISIIRPKELFICHIFNGKLSYSKIINKTPSPLTDEDILDVSDIENIFSMSRNIQKYMHAFIRNEISIDKLLSPEQKTIIFTKDYSKENIHNIKDLKLEQDAKITKTDYELKEQLSVYPQKHGIKNMPEHLRERIRETISELPSNNITYDDSSDDIDITD